MKTRLPLKAGNQEARPKEVRESDPASHAHPRCHADRAAIPVALLHRPSRHAERALQPGLSASSESSQAATAGTARPEGGGAAGFQPVWTERKRDVGAMGDDLESMSRSQESCYWGEKNTTIKRYGKR